MDYSFEVLDVDKVEAHLNTRSADGWALHSLMQDRERYDTAWVLMVRAKV